MNPIEKHQFLPQASFDGGDLDCGSGLLFLIRKHLDPLNIGELLEIISTESSVEEELPAWCRLTKNELVSWTKSGKRRSFLIAKSKFDPEAIRSNQRSTSLEESKISPTGADSKIISPIRLSTTPDICSLAVMGIGSWPRPPELLSALSNFLQGKMSRENFDKQADLAVKLAVAAQIRAGVDVITDGEQHRDNYSSFVGSLLENCELVPLTDLLPLVADPKKFEQEMQALEVPADKVRHPVILGKIRRSQPLTVREFDVVKALTDKPIKIALPGPYLLTRTMWMDCIPNKIYATREELSQDIVRVLREEIQDLLLRGVSIVQLDEPILTEVVFAGAKSDRSFMCGALSERGSPAEELEFAVRLINAVVYGFPSSRLAIHICRGNWTADESLALIGNYDPLLPLFEQVKVGVTFLEFCTPRAGQMDALKEMPASLKIGVGVVNPKNARVETLDEVLAKASCAIDLIGKDRLFLTPDCGFATFADSPVASFEIAERKLAVISQAAQILRKA